MSVFRCMPSWPILLTSSAFSILQWLQQAVTYIFPKERLLKSAAKLITKNPCPQLKTISILCQATQSRTLPDQSICASCPPCNLRNTSAWDRLSSRASSLIRLKVPCMQASKMRSRFLKWVKSLTLMPIWQILSRLDQCSSSWLRTIWTRKRDCGARVSILLKPSGKPSLTGIIKNKMPSS